MIRSTALIPSERAKALRTEQKTRRTAIGEYALLLVMVMLGASVNYLNMRSDDQDQARAFAAKYMRQGLPRPPYIISTPMRKETILIGTAKVERQWFFNDDASMRYVDTVPAEAAAEVGYLRNDVVYSQDRRRKVWQRTDVAKGDNGHPAGYVSFQFAYTTDSDYTVSIVSATPGGWAWTHHFDRFENDQLASQVIYERSGHSVKQSYPVSKVRAPAIVEGDEPSAAPQPRSAQPRPPQPNRAPPQRPARKPAPATAAAEPAPDAIESAMMVGRSTADAQPPSPAPR